MASLLKPKTILLIAAAALILLAFWLSRQGVGFSPPELVAVERSGLIKDLHPLDKLLIRYPREGRAIKGFYRPRQTVVLQAFEIDRCEVSQGDYGSFLQWHQINRPGRGGDAARMPAQRWRQSQGFGNPAPARSMELWYPEGIKTDADWLSRSRDHKFLGRSEVPATGIRPVAAQAYCRQMGGDLPTEFQWEVAAGAGQRLYPWGDKPPATKRLFHDPVLNIAQACGSDEAKATPSGVQDLGNGASNFTRVPPERLVEGEAAALSTPFAIKGGGWRQPDAIHALNFLRAPASAELSSNYVGFRCAYPARHSRRRGRALTSPWKSAATTVRIPQGQYNIGHPEGSVLLKLSESINVSQYLGLIKQADQADQGQGEQFVTRAEVTVDQYRRFLDNFVAALGFYDHPIQPKGHSHIPLRWEKQLDSPGKPVRGVNWWSATAYANWLGGRLLSEQEWMLLGGGLKREYPDSGNAGRGVLRDPRYMQRLHPADAEDNDLSDSGLLAMGGNVMEWTRTIIPGSALNFVVKGGSFRTPKEAAKVSNTSFAPPEYRSMDLGFRVIFPDRPSWHRR